MAQDGLLDRSWAFLGRSWSDLARLGANLGSLGAILEPLGAILGRSWAPKEGQTGKGREGGRRHAREAGPPLETFYESFCLQGT